MTASKDFRPQSAVIPYRLGKKGPEVLLITSLDTGRWVLPKGGIASGLSPRKSAGKEAYEEAGIRGAIAKRSVGEYTYQKKDCKKYSLCHVEVFPMEVREELDSWPEVKMRRRRWMSFTDAASRVAEKKLRKILQTFGATLRKAS